MTTMTAPPTVDQAAPADPAADVLPPAVVMPADPAPYGYQADGVTPKAKPGRRPGQRNGTGQTARKATTAAKTPGAPATKKTANKPPQQTTEVDYRPGIIGIIGQGTAAVLTFGVMKGDPALIADAATVDNAAPAVAEMVNQAADQWPIVAAVCDKVLAIGPHASGVVALVGMFGQIMVNHGMLPAGLIPGTVAREQLAKAYVDKRAAESEEFRQVLGFIRDQQQRSQAPAPASAS